MATALFEFRSTVWEAARVEAVSLCLNNSPANYSLHCAHKKHIHQYLTGLRETYWGNMKHLNMNKLHITGNFTI